MNTRRRPISISIISWFLIITAVWTIFYTPFSINNPVTQQIFQATGASPLVALLIGELGGIANITAGAAMLKRRRWGRQLYLIATPVTLILSVLLYGVKFFGILLFGFVMYGVFFVLLTRRPASDYFSNSVSSLTESTDVHSSPVVQEAMTGKRVASILLLIPGGFILFTWFMMILPMSSSALGLIFLSAIFGVLASAFVIPAVLLWGRKRWAVVVGTLITSVGGMLLMISVMFYSFTTIDAFREQFANVNPTIMEQLILGSLIIGIAAAAIGALLILLQKEYDKETKPTPIMS